MEVLRNFEDQRLLPLLQEIKVEPVRDDAPVTMLNGGVVFMMNNARSYEQLGDQRVQWIPLSVVYCDGHGRTGEVFRYEAVENHGDITIVKAEIGGLLRLERMDRAINWIDPLSGNQFFHLVDFDGTDVMLNAWHLFRGGVLPALYDRSWQFTENQIDRRLFQIMMFKRIRIAYGGQP